MKREEILEIAADLAQRFAERAAQHDMEGSFPYENFDDLRAAGYPKLTVPAEYGGWGAGLLDTVQAQEILGMGDGSTALAMTMHVQTVGAVTAENWPSDLFAEMCAEITSRGALVNSCASEPELGSPSRGGRPMTTAHRDGDEWIINGRKIFASMSPTLDYFIVSAAVENKVEGKDEIARFLVPKQPGVVVEDTWDSMGMRGTGSNDVVLVDARVPDRMRISQVPVGYPDPNKAVQNAWFALGVSAVYLGIAAAAQRVALEYAHQRTPTALGRPIATLESIQRRLGESELTIQVARSVLYRTAEQWDRQPEERANMGEAIMIAKITVTNSAIKVVDDAMRVVGGTSMTHQLPLERYYRDVRAGLYHPPADDSALPLLGRIALQRIAPLPG
jgi:alkylation response protein AidB-like acyl-CoA dehydrogenase